VVLLDTVPGTLFLKTLDSNRYLAIPVELLDFVPGTDGFDRFVQYAVRVWNVDLPLSDKEGIVEEAIQRLQAFYKRIGMPTTLADANIADDKLRFMAENAFVGEKSHLGNFKKLSADDVEKIYRLAL